MFFSSWWGKPPPGCSRLVREKFRLSSPRRRGSFLRVQAVFQHPLERALNRRARNAPASLLPSLKKQRSGSACSARSHGLGLRPTNVRLAARHSPSLSLGAHHQTRFKSFNLKVLAVGIFLIILNVLLRHNNPQWAVKYSPVYLLKLFV